MIWSMIKNIYITKNITSKKINTDSLLKLRLTLKDYSTEIEYIPGEKNLAEDALSIFLNN